MASASPLTELLEEAFPPWWHAVRVPPGERLRVTLARRNPVERRRIFHELDDLTRRGLCDVQLADVIAFELGCHLAPGDLGLSPSEWLAWLKGQIPAL